MVLPPPNKRLVVKIYLYSPDYTHKSAGVKVLHYMMYLCALLGHKVKTNASVLREEWIHPNITTAMSSPLSCDCVVAPEIQELAHLPISMPVMRWILFFPGARGGPNVFGLNEICYVYPFPRNQSEDHQTIAPSCYKQEWAEFFLPARDIENYESTVPRTRDLVFIYKGAKKYGTKCVAPHKRCVVIKKDMFETREQFLNALKKTRTFYSYDDATAALGDAHLCGCECKVFDGENWKDWRPSHPPRFRSEEADLATVKAVLDDFFARWKVRNIEIVNWLNRGDPIASCILARAQDCGERALSLEASLNKCRMQIKEITNLLSWKLTRPFRAGSRLLRRRTKR